MRVEESERPSKEACKRFLNSTPANESKPISMRGEERSRSSPPPSMTSFSTPTTKLCTSSWVKLLIATLAVFLPPLVLNLLR
eukprot:CAMPEP_0115170324 /NCGR_PEP_ID=MMETSP0270-20121206/1725_1 /TAXON_ID=71861 /ORGANISM="Scrippsiella trochoidea, Strain CCMP3099" /LENGTH=81 /DNA_ID=CAMNT_0002583049 /DNA_START=40 /DNA_END=285 /DNA_ORIENTATION=+